MTRNEHARFEELAAGHALNALEPGDEEAFLAHLPSCAVCERALAEHIETAAHLAYAADPVDLPDALLGRIRADVAASGRAMAPAPEPAPEPAPAVALDVERARRGAPALSRAWVAAAAAGVLVLSLLSWNAVLMHDRSQTDQRADRLAAAVALLEQGRAIPLSDDSGRAVATAVMQGDRSVSLVLDGLPANDKSSTYVLWQTGPTGTRAVGAFDVRGGGVDVVRDLPLVTTLTGWKAFAVTKEPGRTAPKLPGSAPVASGTLGA